MLKEPQPEGVKLKVGELTGREDFGRGIARLDANTMKAISVKEGDVIEIRGKRTTAAIAVRSYPADVGLNIVRIDGLVRKNCGTSIGEGVIVVKANAKEAKKIVLAPAEKGYILRVSPNLLKQNLFMRPMVKGDLIIANPVFRSRRGGGDVFEQFFGVPMEEVFLPMGTETRLAVVKTAPEGAVQITEMTELELLPEATELEEGKVSIVTYEDIGGLGEIVPKIREMIEVPLRHPEVFERLGVEPPKGVLLHGPPGSGKTLLAKAVANESGAYFISVAGPELVSKWYGGSLPYEEKIMVSENGFPMLEEIGKVVERDKIDGLKVLAFDKDGKCIWSEVSNLIKHKNHAKIYEITTRSGRKIKVTGDHSLFTLMGNKVVSIKTADLKAGESYIAIPKWLPQPEKTIEEINLLEELKDNDFGLLIREPEILRNIRKKIGYKVVAEALGCKVKYVYDIVDKNVGIPVSKFVKLAKSASIILDPAKISIYSKRKSIPALFKITEDFSMFLGLWVAEGSYNYKDTNSECVRIRLNSKEADYAYGLCKGLFGAALKYNKKGTNGTDIYICSKVSSLFLRRVLGFEDGAKSKKIPSIVFSLSDKNLAAFLKGYFSGDGAMYPNQTGVYTIEGGTRSQALANDIMYLLLRLGIVSKLYQTQQKDGLQYRVCFTGADNIRAFSNAGWIDKEKNLKMQNYLNNLKFTRNYQIQTIKGLASQNFTPLSFPMIVEAELPEESILQTDLYWDRVDHIIELKRNDEYVYDISVNPCQNFIGGLGGIYAHNSEENLRKVFEEAEKNAPTIIFFDEIDAIAPKREEVSGEVERRMVSQLLTLMDGLKSRGRTIVIAATNRPNSLDPALRRGGRFDRELEIPVPDKKGRKEILQIHTRHMPMDGVDLEKIAEITYGYVGADISALVKEAAMHALRRVLPEVSALKEDEALPKELLEKLKVTSEDFEFAMRMVQPSAMREVLIEIPKVKWADVGGLEYVKELLKEAVDWPLKNSDAFKRIGIKPPRGIMLYGPPGCGKTFIVKALANEAGANFISVKGPELLSKWVGESEQHLRDVFRRAKQVAPCIIFFDEIDSLAPRRGSDAGNRVTEQVVSQLLTEMSGIENMEGVMVIAATNRPDIIDPALLRPGRFDRLIYVPAPDEKTRLEILKVHTKSMPLAKEVSMEKLAKQTDGYSGADLEAVVREAGLNALRENMKAKEITKKHFDESLKEIKPSITEDIFMKYQKIVEEVKKTKLEEHEKSSRYIG